MERKTLSLSDCQIKMADDGEGRFAGYASVFGGVDSYGDTILKGAFESTLKKNGKPKMFAQHESWGLPIGKWLTAKEDDHGLYVEGEFTPGLTRAQDTYAALKHGTVDGLSSATGSSPATTTNWKMAPSASSSASAHWLKCPSSPGRLIPQPG